MDSFYSNRNLKQCVKAGLQLCYSGINKYPEKEYDLFTNLAKLYSFKGNEKEYPKIAAIYQYLYKLIQNSPNGKEEKCKTLSKNLGFLEKRFIEQATKKILNDDYYLERSAKNEEYRSDLKKYREKVQMRLKAIEDLGIIKGEEALDEEGLQKRISEIKEICGEIREYFIGQDGLIKKLIAESIKQLGGIPLITKNNETKPCMYAIFGLGSMALGTMTPWSDIEFGIFIEEGLSKAAERKVKEYFRNLTALLHIKIVNFGETPLRMMGIKELNDFKMTEEDSEHNWFFDDLIKSGFSFDGPHWHACKTPIGRLNGYCKIVLIDGIEESVPCRSYELIGTVKQFLKFYEDRYWYENDPQLIQGLKHATFIMGENDLIGTYRKELKKYEELIKLQAFHILKEDSTKLNPFKQMSVNEEGHLLSAKKEIYRFPERTIVALADGLGGEGENIWELLRNTSLERLMKNLNIALSIAIEIRLRTYANNGGQKEDMSITAKYESQIEELKDKTLGSVFYLKNSSLLYRYYHIVLETVSGLNKIQNVQSLNEINEKAITLRNTALHEGYIHIRFSKYYHAIEEFEKIPDENDPLALANLYSMIGKYREALMYYLKILMIEYEIYRKDHPDIASSLNNVGNTLEKLGRHKDALKYHWKSLNMRYRIYGWNNCSSKNSLAKSLFG